MKKIAFLLFTFFCIKVYSQSVNNHIVIGTADSIYSKLLHEQRKIWVYVPDSIKNAVYSPQRYAVIYLLDAEAQFYSVVGLIQQLSEANGNTVIPKMIVVGIPNTDRHRDLTPSHSYGLPYTRNMDSNYLKTSGGAENFTAFIEKELMPHIDSLYATTPYRILIGHSFGGLFTINALMNHTDLFNAYIAIDPSLWWDDQKLLKAALPVLENKKFDNKTLFIAVANTMNAGIDTAQIKTDTADASIHIRSILKLCDSLKKNNSNGLRFGFKYYNNEDHFSVPLLSEYDALHFIFNNYNLPSFNAMRDSSFNVDSAVVMHFKLVSKTMEYTILPPEYIVNSLAEDFLQFKIFDKAYVLFKMNIDNYPSSHNALAEMGNFYEAKQDYTSAIEYYTKALSIKDDAALREKIKKLTEKK